MSRHGREPAALAQIEVFHLLLDFLPHALQGTLALTQKQLHRLGEIV
jgi:hypothetical protein